MSVTETFRALHSSGVFLLPNPWDAGSARYMEWRGAKAVATTSSGFAATLGRSDQTVTRDELLRHAELIASAVSIPVNVDSERCYGDDPDGVAETVRLLAATGAAGCSIEDYDPESGSIDPLDKAIERTQAAAEAAAEHGLVLTARTENHLYGVDDLDDTIERLRRFRQVGAEVVYAPGLVDPEQIRAVVEAVEAPVNVLATPKTPSVPDLGALGVRRVSTGGSLAWAALGGLRDALDELLDEGTSAYMARSLRSSDRRGALAQPGDA